MMSELNEFHFLVGETLMFCQTVELDIKYIYAAMLKGDFDENYEEVEALTLGQTLKRLKKLDYSDNDHFFTEEDYKLLEEITEKRNHIVHKTYQDFVYDKGYEYTKSYNKELRDLRAFHDRMSRLSDNVEEVRFKALEVYHRN